MVCERAPCLGEKPAHTGHEPFDLVAPAQEDAAQRKSEAMLRMRFGIRKCETGPPGSTEDEPAIDIEMLPEGLNVRDEMSCRVVRQVAERCRTPGTPLVKNHDPVVARIEEPPMRRNGASPRPSVQEDDRDAFGVSALLPIEMMRIIDCESSGLVGFDFRK